MTRIRLGSRGSRLALAQVEIVTRLLAPHGIEVEPVIIRTSGDKGDRDRLGAFVGEIQTAVLEGHVDAALHCLKDLPTRAIPGLTFAAYLEREDPRESLISPFGRLKDLPTNAVVGTGSVRRTAQLAALRSDLQFRPLVGNIDTRIEKLRRGDYHAIVLALAGLNRLGSLDLAGLHVQTLDLDAMIPAPGQGVLVLEARPGPAADALHPLNHLPTELASRAERAFLARFGGGCSVPIGAYASGYPTLELHGFVGTTEGPKTVQLQGTDPETLGRDAAEILIAAGVLIG